MGTLYILVHTKELAWPFCAGSFMPECFYIFKLAPPRFELCRENTRKPKPLTVTETLLQRDDKLTVTSANEFRNDPLINDDCLPSH